MSLENEFLFLKGELKREIETLAKFESIEIVEDENNPASIEHRIEAKNRGIESCKEQIKEIKELIAEVKGELCEFIKNGGEVSQLTLDELKDETDESEKDSSEKLVYFKIIAKENENIKLTGCVDINTIYDDDPDFEYKNWQGVYTYERDWDIQAETSWKLDKEERLIRENICNKVDEEVCGDYSKNAQCLFDFQDENRTIERNNYYLIINDGAKGEMTAKEYAEKNGYEWEL